MQLKTKIYQILSSFIQAGHNHDLGTRLTAARSLGHVETWGFEEAALLPFYGPIIGAILDLITQVQTIEARIRLTNTLGLLIERMGSAVRPCLVYPATCPADLNTFRFCPMRNKCSICCLHCGKRRVTSSSSKFPFWYWSPSWQKCVPTSFSRT